MRGLEIELLDGTRMQVPSPIESDDIADHGRFLSRNGGAAIGGEFIPFHAIKRIVWLKVEPGSMPLMLDEPAREVLNEAFQASRPAAATAPSELRSDRLKPRSKRKRNVSKHLQNTTR